MKVLLFADLSGFQQALRDGLAALGVDVTLASSGDGFKAIEGADFRLGSHPDWSRLRKTAHRLSILRLFPGHDIVQFVNPMALAGHPALNALMLRYVRSTNTRLFTAICSIDHRVYAAYCTGELRLGPYGSARDDEGPYRLDGRQIQATQWQYDQFITMMDGIIPIAIDYEIPYAGCKKMHGMIPAPVRLDRFEYQPNRIASGKIVFMHGVQKGREGFKGTRTIQEALDWLKESYPNDVEVLYPSNLPLKEYKSLMYRANVVVDQCNCLAPGLNALQAMAMGRIVLSGSEPEHRTSMGVASIPIVSIVNDAASIKASLLRILENKSNLEDVGQRSRAFVEQHHDHVRVAQRYIDRWSER